jgi:hypothetical protein
MRLRPTSAAIAAIAATAGAAALTLSGCGASSGPTADDLPTTASTPTGSTPGHTTGHTTGDGGATTGSTPSPVSTPTQTEGDGDAEGDDTPATAGGGICSDLSSEEVAAVLAGAVTGSALPGGGCGFARSSAKAPGATFVERSLSKTPGGMEGAKSEATSSVEGEPRDLRGIGDAAFVVTGTAFGEPAVQGAGAVRVGNRVIIVNLTQNVGMRAAAVEAMTIKLLRLAADQAS